MALGSMIKVSMDSNDQMELVQLCNGAGLAFMAYMTISKWTIKTSRPQPTSMENLIACWKACSISVKAT